MSFRAFFRWCMLFFALIFAPNVFAASGTARVVLVGSDELELARKVRAEAEHVGILIVSERTPRSDAELLERYGAAGVVELVSPDRVRIHVAASGEHGAYETLVERGPADGDAFAVRVVEQLRGRLVEIELLPREPEGPGATTKAATGEKPARPSDASATPIEPAGDAPGASEAGRHSPTLGLAVGGSLSAASGGIGLTPGIALGLRLEPSARWSAAVHALVPLVENEVEAPEGEASVRVNLFMAEVGYSLAPASARVRPELGAGAGLVVLPMEGETALPRESHTDQLVAGVYFLHAGAGFSPVSWLALRFSVRGGVSAPRPVIEFSDREVASWGRPFLATTLEAEFQLPLSGGKAAR